MKQHMERVQAGVAIAIVLGFYAQLMLPIIFPLSPAPDPGLTETSKNVMLILVGFLFGSAVKRDVATTPPVQPGFSDTQPNVKDMTK